MGKSMPPTTSPCSPCDVPYQRNNTTELECVLKDILKLQMVKETIEKIYRTGINIYSFKRIEYSTERIQAELNTHRQIEEIRVDNY